MMSVMDGGDDDLVSEEEWVEGWKGVDRRQREWRKRLSINCNGVGRVVEVLQL